MPNQVKPTAFLCVTFARLLMMYYQTKLFLGSIMKNRKRLQTNKMVYALSMLRARRTYAPVLSLSLSHEAQDGVPVV